MDILNVGRKYVKKSTGEVVNNLILITQFGINMLVPIVLCFFAGIYLDKWLHTNFISIILFFVGALAGFRNVYILAKKSTNGYKKDPRNEKEDK